MAMQPTAVCMVGGSNPAEANFDAAAAAKSRQTRIRTDDLKPSSRLRYRSTGGGVNVLSFPTA